MSELLRPKQVLQVGQTGQQCSVGHFIGGGRQGEVYAATVGGQPVAVKWYFPQWLDADQSQLQRLEKAIESGSPSDRFLWPVEIVNSPGLKGFGYLMALRDQRFKGINDLLARRVDCSFRSLATAGFELADSYWQLHAEGLCYRDISSGNAFFDPETGEVRICDNDNVDVNGRPGSIGGTPRFMAPEIVRGDSAPSADTDRFSLSVLLFYIFFLHHPLEGRQEREIKCFDLPAMRKLYGTHPLFIFDQDDPSNRPVAGEQDNPLVYWPMYPEFFKSRFNTAFTTGLRDPSGGRVRETEWRMDIIRLRDSIVYCGHCSAENFASVGGSDGKPPVAPVCWSCKRQVSLPPRIRLNKSAIVMLNYDTKLFPHHLGIKEYDFSDPVAEVVSRPDTPGVWGLMNLSKTRWSATLADGTNLEVEPHRKIAIRSGTNIHFGRVAGELRV